MGTQLLRNLTNLNSVHQLRFMVQFFSLVIHAHLRRSRQNFESAVIEKPTTSWSN